MDKDIRIWMIGFSLTDQVNRIWFFSFSDLVRVFLGYGFEILDKSIKNKKRKLTDIGSLGFSRSLDQIFLDVGHWID